MSAADLIVPAALFVVAAILLAGLWNMMRGGSANMSQTLMRWRVLAQFAAIILIMLVLFFTTR